MNSKVATLDVIGLGGDRVVDVARAVETSCAVLESGEVLCWGSDNGGALGRGLEPRRSNFPVPIDGLGPGTATAVAVGQSMMFAQRADGSVVATVPSAFNTSTWVTLPSAS